MTEYKAYAQAAEAIRTHLLFPETRQLLDVWLTLWEAGMQGLPDRRKIDPTVMPRLLPRIFILERTNEENRLKYRLAGEEINRRYDYGLIGKHLDEITPADALPRIESYFRATFEQPAIILLSGILFSEREKPGYGERLLLPICDPSSDRPGILGMTYQKQLFPDADAARASSNRTLYTADLATGELEQADATVPK